MKQVTRWQTSDGDLFETLEDAEKHEACKQFQYYMLDLFSHSDVEKILEWILGHKKLVLDLYK